MKKVFLKSIICTFALFLMAGCGGGSDKPTADPKLTLGQQEIVIEKFEGFQLTYTLENIEGTVSWKSEDESVVSVNSEGYVTGVSVGTCNVIASIDSLTASCKVNVTLPSAPAVLHCDVEEATIITGGEYAFEFYALYKGERVEDAEFTVSFLNENPSDVASVTIIEHKATIKGLKSGSTVATISGTVRDTLLVKDIAITVSDI